MEGLEQATGDDGKPLPYEGIKKIKIIIIRSN